MQCCEKVFCPLISSIIAYFSRGGFRFLDEM
uniref:Uncharacterized protein n=1 Tax=Anguilla anguilla TaxID=7936 RepID=A0A0E9UIM1_ANGAN